MFVKTYSYRVQPDKLQEMLTIQQRASQAYARHVSVRSVLLKDQDDPDRWLEIQWFPDEQVFKKGMVAINSDEEISELWEAFQNTLAPGEQIIVEETFEQIWASGSPETRQTGRR